MKLDEKHDFDNSARYQKIFLNDLIYRDTFIENKTNYKTKTQF
jgi:hypothetical protein